MLNVPAVRPLWLLRAFVATQLGGPRERGEAGRWLDMLRLPREGEFADLREWPALRLYLEASGFGA